MLSNVYGKKDVEHGDKQAPWITILFGGGMAANTFYANCRSQGVNMTLDDAKNLREKWVYAFPEIAEHFKPKEIPASSSVINAYMMNMLSEMSAEERELEGADDDEEVSSQRKLYISQVINGMVRTRCSYCASLNVHFQALAAYGLKLAMWKVAMAGYLPRIVNEIHDEIVYYLYPDELKTHIPIIEKCMISGMRMACPDVTVKVESSVMLHWDKGAAEFGAIQWDDQGLPIIEEPPYVKEVLGIA